MASSSQSLPDAYAILLADDSEIDRVLTRAALRQHPRLRIVAEVGDGNEVIAYLGRAGDFKDALKYPDPDLLLLDLNMPFKTGFEVLAWLQTRAFKKLLVVVLSSSSEPEDHEKCLALGAHACYVKMSDREGRHEMMRRIENLLHSTRQAS